MKIIDFDEKFYEYAMTWVALHPGLNEQQVEAHYNEMMLSWLNAPAQWLNGERPGEYFHRYSEPKDLMKLLEEYDKRHYSLPEPLYSRIVDLGETCVDGLMRMVANRDRSEDLRATALSLLDDIGSARALPLYVDLVCSEDAADDELGDRAAEILYDSDEDVVSQLLDRYEDVSEAAQELILEIAVHRPGDPRIYDRLVEKLRNRPDSRALYAALLGKLGDPRAIEALKPMLQLTDLGYLDYIELRSAIEELGGDPGEERTFYGDPDYEAMRNM